MRKEEFVIFISLLWSSHSMTWYWHRQGRKQLTLSTLVCREFKKNGALIFGLNMAISWEERTHIYFRFMCPYNTHIHKKKKKVKRECKKSRAHSGHNGKIASCGWFGIIFVVLLEKPTIQINRRKVDGWMDLLYITQYVLIWSYWLLFSLLFYTAHKIKDLITSYYIKQ